MFFRKKIFFCRKRICFPTFYSYYSLLFKEYFFSGGRGVRHSMLMIFLSWVLYYAYKKCSNSWGHSKSTYALMEEGRGGTPKTCENMQRESDLPRVYVSLYLFKGVFSHLQLLIFVFHFFNGKVKTLTPWKVALYIAANLTLSRYLDINF